MLLVVMAAKTFSDSSPGGEIDDRLLLVTDTIVAILQIVSSTTILMPSPITILVTPTMTTMLFVIMTAIMAMISYPP